MRALLAHATQPAVGLLVPPLAEAGGIVVHEELTGYASGAAFTLRLVTVDIVAVDARVVHNRTDLEELWQLFVLGLLVETLRVNFVSVLDRAKVRLQLFGQFLLRHVAPRFSGRHLRLQFLLLLRHNLGVQRQDRLIWCFAAIDVVLVEDGFCASHLLVLDSCGGRSKLKFVAHCFGENRDCLILPLFGGQCWVHHDLIIVLDL